MFERAVAGESTATLAAEAGVCLASLRKAWHVRGLSLRDVREQSVRDLFVRFCAGERTEDLADEGGYSSANGLRNAWSRLGLYKHKTVRPSVLRALWDRRKRGERTEDLAREIGKQRDWLVRHWRRLGLQPSQVYAREIRDRYWRKYQRAWGLRQDGHSWDKIAAAVGHEAGGRALYRRVVEWRKRSGISPPRYPKKVSGD